MVNRTNQPAPSQNLPSSNKAKRTAPAHKNLEKPLDIDVRGFDASSYKNVSSSPTQDLYGKLQQACDFFNQTLFDGKLPACMLTVQRKEKTCGYFSANRWMNLASGQVHEIAINPAYFARHPLIHLFQTIVHEQCHLWQHEYGQPSQTGYHNHEWANKMEVIGLMPSSTGAPGGKRIGQKMADYPIAGGRFEMQCMALIESGYIFSWMDRILAHQTIVVPSEVPTSPAPINVIQIETRAQVAALLQTNFIELFPNCTSAQVIQRRAVNAKTKYQCPGCKTNLWGKPDLKVDCQACKTEFQTKVN